MNRVIKFRAWDNDFNEWIPENELILHKGKPIAILNNERVELDVALHMKGKLINPNWTLMQFTGLLDKNGKEIYEGDILRYNYHIKYDEDWKGSRKNEDFFGVVEYHDKILNIGWESDETRFVGFILCGCKGTDEEYFTSIPKIDDIEVVGNVFEDGDLIDKK